MSEAHAAGITPDRCQQVYNLLKRYFHIFSAGSQDLGRTDVIKHQIDTQGARPVRQPPRRLPFAKREGQRAITEMSEQGAIEPSTSP